MLGPAQAPRTLAFPDAGVCIVVAAHFAEDALDSVKLHNVHVNNCENIHSIP